ncbi:MAG: YceI family protein [Bacteroidia bacterium]|nr:YceI family protein [Bacteroidia bacterium]NNF31190.1 YceI family protein [Flavobacteriaceae bacterium]MBT8274818.1 YceI family protein [Bacteroidia bacterium]NNJ80631.1 YceI family protein [Flavobacteriaceae bacterium]NNK54620.1 YceI family protein [Flavobacteriaceae bacterium]
MKKIFFVLSMISLLTLSTHAQEKLKTKTGEITFEASVPSFEEVKATNENVSAILNSETGEFAALALVKGFRFKVALMEEHFNENYMESSTYPKAVFKGIIQNFDSSSVTNSPTELVINGSVTMHGETKELSTAVKLWKEGSTIVLSTSFVMKPGDFNIKIPAVVSNKIAEEVTVDAQFSLTK